MELYEKTLTSRLVFDGKVVHLYVDDVELPGGGTSVREIIKHLGAVCVIPITNEGEVVLERQYRYAVGEVLVEIPAGKLDYPGEDMTEAVLRELREETGAIDFEIHPVCVYSVKGKTRINEREEDESFGMLFVAEITSFEELHSEIEMILITDTLVENWTYPLIQPKLIEEAERRGLI